MGFRDFLIPTSRPCTSLTKNQWVFGEEQDLHFREGQGRMTSVRHTHQVWDRIPATTPTHFPRSMCRRPVSSDTPRVADVSSPSSGVEVRTTVHLFTRIPPVSKLKSSLFFGSTKNHGREVNIYNRWLNLWKSLVHVHSTQEIRRSSVGGGVPGHSTRHTPGPKGPVWTSSETQNGHYLGRLGHTIQRQRGQKLVYKTGYRQ